MRRWSICSRKTKYSFSRVLWISGALLLISGIASLCLGTVNLSFSELFSILSIVRFVRFPRMVAAIFAGAGLAGAGVIIQTLLGNHLAGPNIIGVNSGAGLMTLIAGLLFPLFPAAQPIAAFVGALIAVTAVFLLSKRAGAGKTTIILSGVILNSLFNAIS